MSYMPQLNGRISEESHKQHIRANKTQITWKQNVGLAWIVDYLDAVQK